MQHHVAYRRHAPEHRRLPLLAARPGAMPDPCETHGQCGRREASDRLFEQLVRGFRNQLLSTLQTQPPGPARHLRAYIRSMCASVLDPLQCNERVARFMARPRYRKIWLEFVEEACAFDDFDAGRSLACRRAVDEIWLRHAFHGSVSSATLDNMERLLLSVAATH